VKPDEDTLPTVPDDPPAAGPDRALEPPPPDAAPAPAELPAAALGAAVAEGDEEAGERPTEAPITAAHVTPAATTHTLFFFDSRRRTPGRRPRSSAVVEAGSSGEDAGGPDAALVSWGLVGSYSFMMALLHFWHLSQSLLPECMGTLKAICDYSEMSLRSDLIRIVGVGPGRLPHSLEVMSPAVAQGRCRCRS
jgi:hypothetical protein